MDTAELKSRAREQIRGKWAVAIGTVLVANIILEGGVAYKVTSKLGIEGLSYSLDLISLLLGGVISVGLCRFLLNMATRREEARFENLFSGFNIYLKTLGLNILITLAVVAGTLLFIIPGIIVSLMFSQAFYILSEDPSKSITQCINESVNLMIGHKWELFYLELTFIGWWLLSAITLGIAALWVAPYQKLTEANFYLYLKNS
ncbi:YciC family protein [Clostridium sp. D53t1_180928_C8]|uniref:YciC family protein n=1 Tax=Clostridium sp. D53t1_180928_C8 TaxID=2787101 RepID=UPI0018A9504E